MNPNVMFAFIGEPLVAMQIMKLYQKEKKKSLFAYTNSVVEKNTSLLTSENIIVVHVLLWFWSLQMQVQNAPLSKYFIDFCIIKIISQVLIREL